ncbi:MAG: acylglycerol kinase family protein [Candidatus Cloacimonadota bacterium]|nr:acylglycerol kinase family protein [Candidatus Cloacimonadota bacterium]
MVYYSKYYRSAGKASNTIDNVIHTLNHKKIPFEIELTKYPKHAVKISKKAVEAGFKLLVAIGRDASINEVANGIMLSGKQTKLGIILKSGGNDLLRYFLSPAMF